MAFTSSAKLLRQKLSTRKVSLIRATRDSQDRAVRGLLIPGCHQRLISSAQTTKKPVPICSNPGRDAFINGCGMETLFSSFSGRGGPVEWQSQSFQGMWVSGYNLFSATHYLIFLPFSFFSFFCLLWMELLRIYKPQGSLAGTNPP